MKHGKHILAQGYTGGGKTNLLNWLCSGFFASRSMVPAHEWETIVWFDRGKSSEILQLSKIAPLRLLVPEGCNMEITFFSDEDPKNDIEQVHFSTPPQIWHNLDRDKINVVCIQRFLLDPSKFSPVVAKIFKSLILDSFNYKIHPYNCDNSQMLPPITIFIDEINNLAPSKGQGTGTREEAQAGAWIQQNIEQLRSQGIRIIGSVHGWRKVRPGVRSSFPAHVALPGAYYPSSEKPKLSRFNALFEKLETGQACFVFEKDIFSDPIKIPWQGEGKELGYIIYKGQMKGRPVKSDICDFDTSDSDESKSIATELKEDISSALSQESLEFAFTSALSSIIKSNIQNEGFNNV